MSMRTPGRLRRAVERDRGTVLILVLVLIIIGALIVVPLLTYATTVFRANRVLSERTQRMEAGKAGLRIALADTLDTWETCDDAGVNDPEDLPAVIVNGLTVTSECYWLAEQSALLPDQLRYGLVATQVGQEVPVELKGNRFVPVDPSNASEWILQTTTESLENMVWLPELPTHSTTIRSAAGFQMPTGSARPDPCTVFFPGSYEDPLTLEGDVFFTSGVYYFNRPVEVMPGADVVVGDGTVLGCANSTEAALTAIGGPSAHNIGGLGATWLFGDEGKLVVTNEGAGADVSTRLVFNRRYIAEVDADGKTIVTPRDISIASVNGELTEDATPSVIPLQETDMIHVPLHAEDAEGVGPIPSSLLPSTLTPKPREPDPIEQTAVNVEPRNGALEVSWQPPPYDGGLPITLYEVIVGGVVGCETAGATSCVVTGLANNSPVNVSVKSKNARGESLPSSVVSATPLGSADALTVPGAPTLVMIESEARPQPTGMYYDGAWTGDLNLGGVAHIEFDPPTNTGAQPITGYDVTMTPLNPPGPPVRCNPTAAVDEPDIDLTDAWTTPQNVLYTQPLNCDFAGLDLRVQYDFRVVAINATGKSVASSAYVWNGLTQIDTSTPDDPATASVNEASNVPNGIIDPGEIAAMVRHAAHPEPPPRVGQPPIPIVDVRLPVAADVQLFIPGYISVPQGRVLIHNPEGHELSMIGGILAAQFDVHDGRAYDADGNVIPESVDLGFVETIIQRQFKIVSYVSGRLTSTAIVQINQTGAWAVNAWAIQ